jgi:peptidoglycan/LPS O-acetylase OafA/YrhL
MIQMPPFSRMLWIDHLRMFVILLVVNMHACVTYSHVGGWYVTSANEPTLAQKVPFILWQGSLQSFFMGLLFFVSGYFANGSLARRGTGAFLRERVFRLGLPALVYMLLIHPFILVGLNPWHADFGPTRAFYLGFLRSGQWLGSSGPLWFVIALLIFCMGLAAWRGLCRLDPRELATPPGRVPTIGMLICFACFLGVSSFFVRLVQPIGTNVLNMQLCFFPQYIAFFAAGVSASRHGWLQPLASSTMSRRIGWMALFGGPLALLCLMMVFGTKDGIAAYFGGWHWQAFGIAVWEQFSGVGLSLGLLALFSQRFDRARPGLRWLADRSFGVYLFHAPILVGLMMLFRSLPQNLYFLVALLTAAGLCSSFALADIARRIPGLRAIV